jgi:hypothetical protein
MWVIGRKKALLPSSEQNTLLNSEIVGSYLNVVIDFQHFKQRHAPRDFSLKQTNSVALSPQANYTD